MKNLFKKIGSVLIGAAMLSTGLTGVYADGAQDFANGYFWAEYETADKSLGATMNEVSSTLFSGGTGYYYCMKGIPEGTEFCYSYDVNFPSSTEYQFAVNGSSSLGGWGWQSQISVRIDDTDTYDLTALASPGNVVGGPDTYQLAWNTAEASVSAGAHKVTIVVHGYNTAGASEKWYKYALDALCITEAVWDWTPSITTMPTKPTGTEATDGYFRLKGTDGQTGSAWINYTSSNTSLGTVRRLVATASLAEDSKKVTYKINVTEAGKYKVMMNAAADDNYNSPAELYIDNQKITLTGLTGNEYYGDVNMGAALKWYSGAAVDLTAGLHTVTYKLTDLRPAGTYWNSILESITVMPEDYTMEAKLGATPVAPAKPVEATDGYFWLEGEDGKTGASWSTYEKSFFNGGKAIRVTNAASVTADSETVTYVINVTEAGNYKAMMHAGSMGNNWNSRIALSVDDSAYELEMLTGTDGSIYYGDGNIGVACSWYGTNAIPLSAGRHTVTYKLTAKRPGDNNYHNALLDSIVIMPENYAMDATTGVKPEKVVLKDAIWLEETKASSVNSNWGSSSDASLSGGKGLLLNTPTNPGESSYGIKFEVDMPNAGTYDLYYRGSYPQNWASPIDVYVGETKQQAATKLCEEGWIQNNWCIGWNKLTVELSKGDNTVTFDVKESRAGGANTWIAIFDCAVIVPKDMPFTVTGQNITATQADFDIVAAFANANQGIDLANVKSDIVLPATTEDGTEITWTSGNTNVIGNDGSVTRAAADTTVSLLAEYGDNQKSFSVTVKKISDFDVDSFTLNGTVAAGEKLTAKASVASEKGLTAMLLIALYDKDGKMLLADVDSKAAGVSAIDYEISLTAPAGLETGAYAKAFLWSDVTTLVPIMPAITK